ncbi:UNVERIFIED_CONTAM: putative protein phosphatase 2C 60 [Sesamum angustifolium]|uniref:protein-serine/threonine phosphatase n=1 Tax=Sesamum angustifolium TaxID=2727405 RepID=A0AAW2MH30_9LAMI
MGIYLSTPKTEKFSEDGENSRLRFGVSSMQGWRATMEDAHDYVRIELNWSRDKALQYDALAIVTHFSLVYLTVGKCASLPDLDTSTSFFGVYDGHGGKVVAKFCAKYLHQQVLKHEAYLAGDIGTSVQKAFFRMDEMMRGQRGWRELAVLGIK